MQQFKNDRCTPKLRTAKMRCVPWNWAGEACQRDILIKDVAWVYRSNSLIAETIVRQSSVIFTNPKQLVLALKRV
jgi:hypothetical protein